MSFTKTGVSLVELVVVMSILALGSSILLPVLERSREQQRRTVCSQRLRNLVLAAHIYESMHDQLPAQLSAGNGAVRWQDWTSSSGFDDQNENNQNTSVLVQMLPYLGLSELLDPVDPIVVDFESRLTETSYGTTELWFTQCESRGTCPTLTERVTIFECPSDDVNEHRIAGVGAFTPVWIFDIESEDYLGTVQWPFNSAKTNFAFCTGASTGGDNRPGDLGTYRGVLGFREIRQSRLIPDGLSNSVMFGENIGRIGVSDSSFEVERQRAQLWNLAAAARGRGSIPFGEEPNDGQSFIGSAMSAHIAGFGSMHPDGANFAFADGAVRHLTRDIQRDPMYAICGAFDGDKFSLDP